MYDKLKTTYNLVWKLYCMYIVLSLFFCIFGPWQYQRFDIVSQLCVVSFIMCFLLVVVCCFKIAFKYHIKGYHIGNWKISELKL